MREYLYIPLGGNKNGRIRTYLNLLIVMLLGGLWHGASWNYLFWGAFHGLALIVERIFSYKKAKNAQERFQILRGVLVFIVVTIGWLFFKLINLNHVGMFVKSVASNTYFKNDLGIMSYISIYCLPVVLYHFLNLLPVSKKHELTTKYGFVFYGIMIFLILFNSGRPGAFIYFQF